MMESLLYGLVGLTLIVATIAGIAKHDFKKRKNEYMDSVESKNRYRRTVKKINITLASSVVLLIAFAYSSLDEHNKKDTAIASDEADAGDKEKETKDAEPIDYKQIVREVADVKEMEAALKEVEDSVESVRLEGSLAVIRYKSDESTWSENTLVKEFATDSTEILELLDENPFYEDVAFERFGTLVDDQGNESESGLIKALYLESDVTKLNFENFTDMVWGDASKFYNNATGYAINGAIYTQIETDLQYSMGWANDPETDVYNVYF